jgi:hypothetical protein
MPDHPSMFRYGMSKPEHPLASLFKTSMVKPAKVKMMTKPEVMTGPAPKTKPVFGMVRLLEMP